MKHEKVVQIVLNNFTNDSRVLKESLSLNKNGFNVIVVALHEPSLAEYDQIFDVDVHRIKLISRKWSKNKIIQVIKYIEFLTRTIKYYHNADIFHCNDLNALPIGVVVKLLFNRKTKVIYDAHEFEINDVPNQSYISKKVNYLLEKYLIKYADNVITVSETIAKEYVKLYSIQKPFLVLNCPPYKDVNKKNLFRTELGIRDDQKIFLYQGGFYKGRGIDILLEAFAQLGTDKNVIVFMGYGSLEPLIKRYTKKYNTIYYKDAVSPEILLDYTASAEYGILFYENSCLNHNYCSPNKMFEYLMAGIPVLSSNLLEMKRLVEKYNLGIVAKENTVGGFLEAVEQSLKQDYELTVNNVREARKLFNWEIQEKVLLKAYNEF